MRTVIAEEFRELLSTDQQVVALVAAIDAIDDTDTGCIIDAIITTSDQPPTTKIVVSTGPSWRKILAPLADLNESAIQKICDFVAANRNAS